MDNLIAYWPLALIGVLVGLLLLYLLFRGRQRVSLTDSAPMRPHMTPQAKSSFGTRPVVVDGGEPAIAEAARTRGPQSFTADMALADDLMKLKGVGPKLAAVLNSHGLTRFEQIAKLSAAQVAELDDSLGAFRGRLTRDSVIDQADYLARGDIDGFEQRFGKL